MTLPVLHHKTLRVQRQLEKALQLVLSANTLDAALFPGEYLSLYTKAALLCEEATCLLRNSLYSISKSPQETYLSHAASVHGIQISFEDGIVQIIFPSSLPKVRGRHSKQFMFEPLNAALSQFRKTVPIAKYKHCTICIQHVYDATLSERMIFDYDNLEQKQLLDTLAAHLLTDDNALLCDVYHTSFASDRNRTNIYIMEKEHFLSWLFSQKTA